MTTLQFADTHNLVAFLTKSAESEGFEQIVDFLNASSIKYALTVNPTIYTSCIEQFWSTVKAKMVNGEVQLQALVDGKKIVVTEASVRRDLQLEDADGVDSWKGLVGKVTVFVLNYDSARLKRNRVNPRDRTIEIPLSSVPVGDVAVEGIYEGAGLTVWKGLTAMLLGSRCRAQERGVVVPGAKTPWGIPSLRLGGCIQTGEENYDIDVDEDITLENVYDDDMFRVNDLDLDGDEVLVETEEHVVNAATTTSTIPVSAAKDLSDVDMTLAQALAELKSTKPKAVTNAATTTTTIVTRPKAKGLDKVETDYELAQRLQAEEQKELIIKEKSKLFQQLLEKRRKYFVAKIAEERGNRPPTKAQQRSIMCTYLKNMAGWKPKDLKTNSFANVQELFNKAMTRLEQEPLKKQKMEDDKEIAELQSMMEVIPDEEEVAVDAIPLATKPPSIVDWKIIKEGKIGYYQIIRADGNSKRYSSMIQMLKSFDKEDLETLWKLVKAKHGYKRPEEGYERVLWGDLKIMFEHNIEDTVWRNLLGNKMLIWKLFNSCGVHFVRFQDIHIFMLVEKRNPLTPATIIEMLNRKLQADHCNEMCYQLLKLMTKQLKKQ
ncbi:hypothetical protein Tco_1200818 [Tanacetum coccineum]